MKAGLEPETLPGRRDVHHQILHLSGLFILSDNVLLRPSYGVPNKVATFLRPKQGHRWTKLQNAMQYQ
jgi:hypothetical protein